MHLNLAEKNPSRLLGALQSALAEKPKTLNIELIGPGALCHDTALMLHEEIRKRPAGTLIHARTSSGGDIRVVVPRDKRVKVGEALHLKPDPRQTHFFGEDGKAVRA